MADTKRRIKNEEIKKETTEPEAVSQSTAMQERMESVSRKILITARNEDAFPGRCIVVHAIYTGYWCGRHGNGWTVPLL